MVTKEDIKERGLTPEDVMEYEFAEPQRSVKWLPEWDDEEESHPGENLRIEDETLIWERDGFEARLESYNTTHWRAEIDIPEEIGSYYPREIDLKCNELPQNGFVESVDVEEYAAREAVLIIGANFQPTFEVNHFIDDLIGEAEAAQEFQQEVKEKISLAEENRQAELEQRSPGWDEDLEAFVCPHCKETSRHVSIRDDGGANCLHCDEPIDDHVVHESEIDEDGG